MTRILLLMCVAFISSFSVAIASMDSTQKAEIEAIIKDYIMNNPEVMLDSFDQYRAEQDKKAQIEQDKLIQKYNANLDVKKSPFVAGNPDGDVTIVEFFDYNCGYCKKAFGDLKTFLKEDKNLNILFVEMPVLGPSSEEAAKWASAAAKQGKYFDFHKALITHNGPKNEDTLSAIAKKVGLDVARLKKDKDDEEIEKILGENITQARNLGFTGTPGFLINGIAVKGYLPYEQMKAKIQEARAKVKKK